jgi:hypothetical protein
MAMLLTSGRFWAKDTRGIRTRHEYGRHVPEFGTISQKNPDAISSVKDILRPILLIEPILEKP